MLARGGEPVVRKDVDMAMRLMGEQFVTGGTIGKALAHAGKLEARGFCYSYDMLGEAALTDADALRYMASCEHLAGQNYCEGQCEFQCLHGMGEPLFEQVVGPVAEGKLARPCRIYALRPAVPARRRAGRRRAAGLVAQGQIVQVQGLAPGETGIVLERLLIERSLSVNTAAAGGNASLMSVG